MSEDWDYESRLQRNYEAQMERKFWHRVSGQEPILRKGRDEYEQDSDE